MSRKQPSLKMNYIYRMLYEVLTVITPLVTSPYISRVLGADGIGVYSFTHSIITYFTLCAALGTTTYGMREIARFRDNREQASKLFWEIELMTVMTSTVCLVGWFIVALFGGQYQPYFIALTPVLFGTMFDISWFYTGYEQVKYTVIVNTVFKFSGVVALFLFVKDKNDLLVYFIINSLTAMLGSLSMWLFLPRMLVKVDLRQLRFKCHFKETMIYFVPAIATSIYTVLDKTLIGIISKSAYENGYYEQATKIVNIVKSVVFSSLNYIMGARMSYLYEKGRSDEIKQKLYRSMDFIFFVGYGAFFGIIAVSKRFVPLFFGAGYDDVVPILRIMSLLILIIGVSNCIGSQYLTPSGQRKKTAKIIILGSFVNLIMNLFFIPIYGAIGATIASVAAELLIAAFYIYFSREYMTLGILWKLSKKRLLAGIIMCSIVYFLGEFGNFHGVYMVALQIAAGVAVYFLALLILKDGMIMELIYMGRRFIKKRDCVG